MNILITGVSSGIGNALAFHYLTMGHFVYGTGRNQVALKSIQEKWPESFFPIVLNMNDQKQVKNAFENISKQLDLVILNAGSCEYVDIDQFDSSLFERVFHVNVLAQMYFVEELLKILRPSSKIAFMSSSSTILPLPRAEAYGSSKAALDYIAETLSITLRDRKISVSLIQPGFVKTALTDKNDFPMPFLISSEKAANIIARELKKNKFLIRFPKRLTVSMQLISVLPKFIRNRLLYKLIGEQ
jgi:short-subunit dehydrogenase